MINHCKISILLAFFYFCPLLSETVYIVPFPGQEDDKLFSNISNPFRNRDDMLGNFFALKESINRIGYEVKSVASIKNLPDAKAIVCLDIPAWVPEVFNDLQQYPLEKRVLFLFEPPSVRPDNYDKNLHKYFGKIYTWMDDLVDNKKYFKFYEMQPTITIIDALVPFDDKKLCVILAGGRHDSPHPSQLYGERICIINYFEQYAPADLDFYGACWENTRQGKYQVYKGYAMSKIATLKNYRFCICYENMYGLKGYVTAEKILYCLVSGCIPVYWGASNITDYIPKDCFIDRRDFADTVQLHRYLKSLPQEEYEQYLSRIKEYLQSSQVLRFSREYWIDIFIRATVGDYDWSIAFTPEQKANLKKLYESSWR